MSIFKRLKKLEEAQEEKEVAKTKKQKTVTLSEEAKIQATEQCLNTDCCYFLYTSQNGYDCMTYINVCRKSSNPGYHHFTASNGSPVTRYGSCFSECQGVDKSKAKEASEREQRINGLRFIKEVKQEAEALNESN